MALSVSSLQEVEENQFQMSVTMPTGSTLESTDVLVSDIEGRLKDIQEIKDVASEYTGRRCNFDYYLKDDFKDINNRTVAEIKMKFRDKVNNIRQADISIVRFFIRWWFGGGGGGGRRWNRNFSRFLGIGSNQEQIIIKGEDFDVMKGVAEDLEYYIEDLESIRNVRFSVSSNQPEIHLHFNPVTFNRLWTEFKKHCIGTGFFLKRIYFRSNL